MKHAICLITLQLIFVVIMLLAINYQWNPLTVLMVSLNSGAMFGYVAAKMGYFV